MHTMWKGTISFGLVNIPVKMHAATENKDVKLRQLHKECNTPVKYEKVCPHCEKELQTEDIVKAYEYTKNKFVVLDEDELQVLQKEQEDKAVEIVDFVSLEEIDPIYFERCYYLSPNEGGTKAYSLLRKALEDTGKIGVASMVIRSKQQLAVIRVYKNVLVVETIHYPDEVRNVADVPNIPAEDAIVDKELKTAKLLIEQLTATFDPEKYNDDYREALLDLIQAKRDHEEVHIPTAKKQPSNVTNLMDALQASLDKAKKDKPAAKKTTRKKAAARPKKKPEAG